MKYLPLLLANLRRKKIRTGLTIGSFAVALFLFGLLFALRAGLRQGVDVAGSNRLMVMGTSLMNMLPLPYLPRIERIPGVEHVAHATWFGGVYKDPKNFFVQFAIDPARWRAVYPEYVIDEQEWRAFAADRQGVVVGAQLAKRYGWKVGDHIPLMPPSYLGSTMWDFNVRGIYHGDRPGADEGQFWMQYDYIQENGPTYFRGIVGFYLVRLADPDAARKGGEDHRHGVPQLGERDPHPDRVRLRRRVPEADGQHRVPGLRHRLRRLLHPPPGHRQHDGHRGP